MYTLKANITLTTGYSDSYSISLPIDQIENSEKLSEWIKDQENATALHEEILKFTSRIVLLFNLSAVEAE